MKHNIPPHFVGVISREKIHGGGQHFGVKLHDGRVVDFSREGVRFTTLATFLDGKPGKAERAISPTQYHQAFWRATASVGTMPAYHLVDFNCEHFANHVAGGVVESGQIKFLALLGIVGAVWYAFGRTAG